MILFINQNIEKLKLFYFALVVIAGFILAIKIPQFYFGSDFIAMMITLFVLGLLPIKYAVDFDFSLNAGLIFIVLLHFGIEKSFLPLLIVNLVVYFIKIVKRAGVKRALYNGLFDNLFILIANVWVVSLYGAIKNVFPDYLSFFLLWVIIIISNFILFTMFEMVNNRKENFWKKTGTFYFIALSLVEYMIALISLHLLIRYNLVFYITYSVAIILFFVYLHMIQINNIIVSNLIGNLNKLNRIKIEHENKNVKEFIIYLYKILNRYLRINCIGIKESNTKMDNIIIHCSEEKEEEVVKKGIDLLKNKNGGINAINYKESGKYYMTSYKLDVLIDKNIYLFFILKDINKLKENILFFDLLKNKIEIITENIYLYEKAREEFLNTIEMIIYMIEAKDKLTAGHSIRVAKYSYLIGQKLGLDKKELDDLKFAALLHDIGKIAIPENILNKTTELTDDEFNIIKKHTIIGANLINNIDSLKDSVPGIIEHHERYDGSGYPNGIKGKDISLQGRIIAVADAFDAVTSNRVYRYPIKRIDAMAMIIAGSYSRFDPEIVEIFAEIINRYNGEYIDEKMINDIKI